MFTTAGEGTWMLSTERGRMLLANWHSNTPSRRDSGKLSGNVTFNLFSIVYKYKQIYDEYIVAQLCINAQNSSPLDALYPYHTIRSRFNCSASSFMRSSCRRSVKELVSASL